MGSAGERLKTTRELRDLTRSDLARASGISKSVITKLEQGEREGARLETWRKLAHALRVPTMHLAGDPRPEKTDTTTETQWTAVRAALAAPPPVEGDAIETDAPTIEGVSDAVKAAQALVTADEYATLAQVTPALIRDADALGPEGRAVRVRALQLVGMVMVHNRQFDAAELALRRAMSDAADRLETAASVDTLCWLKLRQGRLGEAYELAVHWADETEPRLSRATPEELNAWGSLLLMVAAAAVRNNNPSAAADSMKLARAAAVAVGKEQRSRRDAIRSFGPTTVAMKTAEIASVLDQPDRVLRLAERVPLGGLSPRWNNRNRHLLDVADAHARTRDYPEAVELLQRVRNDSPQWLPQQRYARDILDTVVRGRRTLTPEMRELAAVVGLPM
ncbi:helix-turn-helix domain-containing protein [Streptomyces sp. NPDC057654]|uniref:helix-turn-helix domain-containing protein n=1 Tax=Streptomyces sp. NPDC057654 TaxID=3346196 RepID=UPI0036AC9E21